MGIADRINKIMKKQGLSRYRVAQQSGVPYTTLIKILDGTTKNPQVATLSAIADVLNVSVDDLNSVWIDELIEKGLTKEGITLNELAERARIKPEFLLHIDSVIPEPWDYEVGGTIDRISRVLKINRRDLATAFARQEPPLPEDDYPRQSAAEDFESEDFEEDSTIAAHHDGEDWTDEELEDIQEFKELLKLKRQLKNKKTNKE